MSIVAFAAGAGVLALSAVASLSLTALARRWMLRLRVLDRPNERSSHTRTTPRGGGVAVIGVLLGGVLVFAIAGLAPAPLALALLGGGLALALVGWIDDRGHVHSGLRAGVQLVVAVCTVWLLGGLPSLAIGPGTVALGGIGALLAVLGVMWCVNLFNFMDGIDGIAATETAFVGFVGGCLLLAAGATGPALIALLMAGAAMGFLRWNWEPARIFLGDVGSGVLGFAIAAIALHSERAGAVPLLVWLILGGVFVLDATVTLLRRVARGDRWHEAHRSHAYQRAARAYGSHAAVVKRIVMINAILCALAVGAVLFPGLLFGAIGVATLVLAAAYLHVERMLPFSDRQGPDGGDPGRSGSENGFVPQASGRSAAASSRRHRQTLHGSNSP
jgi:Fuc2NAc and GlcNAc transferase